MKDQDVYRISHIGSTSVEGLLLALKEQYTHDRDAYTGAKSDFVKESTQKARELFSGRYVLGHG